MSLRQPPPHQGRPDRAISLGPEGATSSRRPLPKQAVLKDRTPTCQQAPPPRPVTTSSARTQAAVTPRPRPQTTSKRHFCGNPQGVRVGACGHTCGAQRSLSAGGNGGTGRSERWPGPHQVRSQTGLKAKQPRPHTKGPRGLWPGGGSAKAPHPRRPELKAQQKPVEGLQPCRGETMPRGPRPTTPPCPSLVCIQGPVPVFL